MRKRRGYYHIADIGHPVVGDKKYGNAKTPHKRLALHAGSISFNHPVTGKQLTIKAEVPACFSKLIGRIPAES